MDRPDDAAASEDGACAGFALKVGECEQHPHCLAGAGEGKGEGDLFGREAEAAEVDGGVLGDWVDYFLKRLVRVVMEGRSDGRNIPAV